MTKKLLVVILLALVVFVYAKIFAPAGKPRKLTPAEQKDSIDRKKPIAEG